MTQSFLQAIFACRERNGIQVRCAECSLHGLAGCAQVAESAAPRRQTAPARDLTMDERVRRLFALAEVAA